MILESGAFVYGSMSFADKLTVGIGMMMIQRYVPSDLNTCTTNCNYDYFQHILVYGCGGAIVLGIVATLILYLLAAKDKKNAESKWNSQINEQKNRMISENIDPLANLSHHLPHFYAKYSWRVTKFTLLPTKY